MGRHFNRGGAARGFTLVEMLVATALTLLLVAALAQAFSIVGTGVTTNRASLELAGQLRSAALRLQDDLAGLTAATVPWVDPASGSGYFEYIDGPDHDAVRFAWTAPNTSFGDADDGLMFTARSDQEPFLGSWNAPQDNPDMGMATIESNLAEIVWFTTLNDLDSDGALEPNQGESYTLYRRALLIRPDLGIVATLPSSTTTYNITSQADLTSLFDSLQSFFSTNDLSVHIVSQLGGISGNDLQVQLVANTLSDLTNRERRFAHRQIVVGPFGTRNYVPAVFPYQLDRNAASATSLPLIRQPGAMATVYDEPGAIKQGNYLGEDVMLARLLAFDVRAFDPTAVVAAHPGEDGAWGVAGFDDNGNGGPDEIAEAGWASSDDEPVLPGDPGYRTFSSGSGGLIQIDHVVPAVGAPAPQPLPPNEIRYVRMIGRGAFVDLNYAVKNGYDYLLDTAGAAGRSQFYGPVTGGCRLVNNSPTPYYNRDALGVFDTWSFGYERDGADQDGDGAADEGTDGLDSDGANGVDDVGERETAPPYAVPLRGIQVRIRMMEPSSRQIRQVSVEANFMPN